MNTTNLMWKWGCILILPFCKKNKGEMDLTLLFIRRFILIAEGCTWIFTSNRLQ